MQATSLSLQDGANPAVSVTFAPEQVTPTLSSFADRTSGIPAQFRRVKVSTHFAKGTSLVNRSQLSVEIPVAVVVNGVPTIDRILRANVELILPSKSTDAERKDLYAFILNAMQNSVVRPALRDLDPLY